jgi:hypothetical protein
MITAPGSIKGSVGGGDQSPRGHGLSVFKDFDTDRWVIFLWKETCAASCNHVFAEDPRCAWPGEVPCNKIYRARYDRVV